MTVINHDVNAEMCLIGTMIVDQEIFDRACQTLDPEAFYDPVNMKLFSILKDFYTNSIVLTKDTFISQVRSEEDYSQGLSRLHECLQFVNRKSSIGFLKMLLNTWKRCRVVAACQNILKNINKSSLEEIREVIDSTQNKFDGGKPVDLNEIYEGEFEGFKNHDAWLENTQNSHLTGKVITGHSTGFRELDSRFNGLYPVQYLVLAGQPGSGKTTLALQITRNLIENGVKVAFISLELTREQVYKKLCSIETDIPYMTIERGMNNHDFHRYIPISRRLKENKNLLVFDHTVKSLGHLRSLLRKFKDYGCQVVCIDYLSLINHVNKNNTERIEQISSAIREELKELKLAGLVLSQLNREGEKIEQPEMYHLFGSGQVGRDAYNCIIMTKKRDQLMRKVFVRKNRFGIMQDFELDFNGCRFIEYKNTIEEEVYNAKHFSVHKND